MEERRKNEKNFASFLLAALLLTLTACGSPSESPAAPVETAPFSYTGYWECESVGRGDSLIAGEEMRSALGCTGREFMALDIRADGTAGVIIMGEGVQGDWSETAEGFTLEALGETLNFT